MEIKNTNIKLKNGAYIIDFQADRVRYTVITYSPKETIKKYKKAGFEIFASPTLYKDNLFFWLTKSLKHRTRRKTKVVIGNQMWHINKALEQDKLKIEL